VQKLDPRVRGNTTRMAALADQVRCACVRRRRPPCTQHHRRRLSSSRLHGLAGTCRACMCPPPVYTAPMAHSGHTRSLRWLSGGGHTCRPGRRVIWMPARTSPGGGASACASARPRSGTSCLPAVGWRRSSPSGCGSRYGYHPRSINSRQALHDDEMLAAPAAGSTPRGGTHTHALT
jgi:hypothetical protein